MYFAILPIFTLVFMFLGCGSSKGQSVATGRLCPVKTIPLTLYEGNINVGAIPDRNLGLDIFMPVKNIFDFQVKSPLSSHKDTHLNYCHITIAATDCFARGGKGITTYTWDSSNDGNNHDSTMNIEIPKNGSFTITVDLYEGCGLWYNSPISKRAIWMHQGYYDSAERIVVKGWTLNKVDDCLVPSSLKDR